MIFLTITSKNITTVLYRVLKHACVYYQAFMTLDGH